MIFYLPKNNNKVQRRQNNSNFQTTGHSNKNIENKIIPETEISNMV